MYAQAYLNQTTTVITTKNIIDVINTFIKQAVENELIIVGSLFLLLSYYYQLHSAVRGPASSFK